MCSYCEKQPVRASSPTGAVSDTEHVTFEVYDCLFTPAMRIFATHVTP
jgi:hypothetical protein